MDSFGSSRLDESLSFPIRIIAFVIDVRYLRTTSNIFNEYASGSITCGSLARTLAGIDVTAVCKCE